MGGEEFVQILKDNGIQHFTGVPCSVFTNPIAYLEANEDYVIAASEGEAMGIAAGMALGGAIPAVFMQNDGLGNAINPLTSLTKLYEFPTLLVISWRGEPGVKDAPQHAWSGKTLTDFLDVMQIRYIILEEDESAEKTRIAELIQHISKNNETAAIICKKGIFGKEAPAPDEDTGIISRQEALEAVMRSVKDDTMIVSTTGKPSREIYTAKDRPNNFYVVGSMGCTSAIALGLNRMTGRQVITVDGDGAILMKMGTLATVGHYQPENFLHICVDNEKYESTGGQTTVSKSINLSDVARACKYPMVLNQKTADEIQQCITDWYSNPKLTFIHIKVSVKTDPALGRPKETPQELKTRFMEHLA